MRAPIRLTTRVLPGKRIELTAPELLEGEEVDVLVALPRGFIPPPMQSGDTQGVWDYIQSLTPVHHTPKEWEELDREFRAERDSWDR